MNATTTTANLDNGVSESPSRSSPEDVSHSQPQPQPQSASSEMSPILLTPGPTSAEEKAAFVVANSAASNNTLQSTKTLSATPEDVNILEAKAAIAAGISPATLQGGDNGPISDAGDDETPKNEPRQTLDGSFRRTTTSRLGTIVEHQHPNDHRQSFSSLPTVATAHAVSQSQAHLAERDRFRQQVRDSLAAQAVQAEPVTDEGSGSNNVALLPLRHRPLQRRLLGATLAVLLVVAIVAGTIVALSNSSTSSPPPAMAPVLPSAATNVSTNVVAPTIVLLPDGRQAFTETSQLYQAVDDYDAAVTVNGTADGSLVALQFGYPMGTWDVSRLTDFSRVFNVDRLQEFDFEVGLAKLRKIPIPDLSGWNVSRATTMQGMFAGAVEFTGDGLADWDVSLVTDFSFCFRQSTAFVGDLSKWNTSSAQTMNAMFAEATSFNGDLSMWNVARVESMARLFFQAQTYQGGDLTQWNVSRVQDMNRMFAWAYAFNGDISSWDTGNVERLERMFQLAKVFNGDVSQWNVGKVASFENLFLDAAHFVGGDLSGWNTSRVRSMISTFQGCFKFQGSVNNWDVSAVTTFELTFQGCFEFNDRLGQWDTSNAVSMRNMFTEAKVFTGDGLSDWNVGKVTDMYQMFKWAFAFNVDLSQWNVSSVQNAAEMFSIVEGYNQSLCSWGTKLPPSADATGMFLQTGCANASDPSLPSATTTTTLNSATVAPLWSGPFCTVCVQA